MSNRVEELEAKVAELESTVDGLTEELVEAKERVRELESELESGPSSTAPSRPSGPGGGPDREEFEQLKTKLERAQNGDGKFENGEEAAPEDVERAASVAESGSESDAVEADKNGDDEYTDETDEHEREGDIIIA